MPAGYRIEQVDGVIDRVHRQRRMTHAAQWKEISEALGFEACREVDAEVRARLAADPYYAGELAA